MAVLRTPAAHDFNAPVSVSNRKLERVHAIAGANLIEQAFGMAAEGRRAVELMFEKAAATGLIPRTSVTLFLD